MPVTKVRKIMDDAAGHDLNGKWDLWVYEVEFSDQADLPIDALGATDGTTTVPDYFFQHPTVTTLYLTQKDAKRTERNSRVVRVECKFSRLLSNFEPPPPGGGIWAKRVNVQGVEVVETTNQDVGGTPIANTIGDVYAADLPDVKYDEMITIEFVSDSLDPTGISAHRGEVNSNDVNFGPVDGYSRTFPAKTIKIGNVASELTLDSNGDRAYRMSIPILYRSRFVQCIGDGSAVEHGWDLIVPNRGYRYFANATTIERTTADVMVYLAENGTKLADGDDALLLAFQRSIETDVAALLTGI
jgi:hypothetical protein